MTSLWYLYMCISSDFSLVIYRKNIQKQKNTVVNILCGHKFVLCRINMALIRLLKKIYVGTWSSMISHWKHKQKAPMVSHLKMTSPRLELKVADFFEETEGRTPIFLPVKVFHGVVRKYTERKQTSSYCVRVRSPLGSDWSRSGDRSRMRDFSLSF